MQLEIISTGDEVITGFITDTNVTFLSQELLALGVQPYRRHTVGDKLADIAALISERAEKADIILVNGGLGPTSDDNTTEAAAEAAGVPLVLHPEWVEVLKKWHAARGRSMPENNVKQAMLPEGAVLIDNPHGTACGFYLKIKRAVCFFTPGVPSEFKPMYLNSIKPYLREHLGLNAETRVKRFFTYGVSESKIGQTLAAHRFPDSIMIGYRAAYPLLEIKVISHQASAEEIEAAESIVRVELAPYLILEDDFDLSGRLDELTEHAPTVIFDGGAGGALPTLLAGRLNITHALISAQPQTDLDLLTRLTQGAQYVMALTRSPDGQVYRYVLCDAAAHKTYIYTAHLNITLKDKKKDAAALAAAAMFYQSLAGLPHLRPDNAAVKCEIRDAADLSAVSVPQNLDALEI